MDLVHRLGRMDVSGGSEGTCSDWNGEADTISINPCIPTVWAEFTLDWRIGGTCYHFVISNPRHWSRGIATAELDGVAVDPAAIPLHESGARHEVRIVLGSEAGVREKVVG